MDRLTMRNENGIAFWKDKRCFGGGYRITEDKVDQERLDRIAAYEDTGLTPDEIKDLRNELCFLCGKYKNVYLGACNGCKWRKIDG